MTTEQMDWLDDERRRRELAEHTNEMLRRDAARPPRDLPRWAGSEPIEYDTMHPDCDCSVCCPSCAVPECGSFDVTARMVPTDGTLRHRARVLLCDEHGGRQPTETEWERR